MIGFLINVALTVRRARELKKMLRVQSKYHAVLEAKLGPTRMKSFERMESSVYFLGMTKTETFLMAGYLFTVAIFIFNSLRAIGVITL